MESSLSPAQDASGAQLAFLKNASDKRVTRDGNPPKRRGPKPDSRPALTRRQELNRQAQRTHRERKELYIKALEDEVLRLKEIYSSIAQDKDRLADENRQLRQLLAQQQQGGALAGNGGPGPSSGPSSGGGAGGPGDDTASNPSAGYSGSASGSYRGPAPSSHTSAFTPPSYQLGMSSPTDAFTSSARTAPQSQSHSHPHPHPLQQLQQLQQSTTPPLSEASSLKNPGIDYEQAGIDFVLTLEKPCMEHMPWLVENSAETGKYICGHALMASCPPKPFAHLQDDVPFGNSHIEARIMPGAGAGREPLNFAPGSAPAQRTWELSKTDLTTLLALSAKLNLDGEITPVMAWGMVLAHPRLGELSLLDFAKLTEELGSKIRCYGFGAVMEEFEVRDALENVLSTKPDTLANAGAFALDAFVRPPLHAQVQAQAQPYMTNGIAGHTHGAHHAHAALGDPSAPPVMYSSDMNMIQPGYAMAM